MGHVLLEGPSPFHFGQQAVQSRAGVRDVMERGGRKIIRKYLSQQHKIFFEELSLLFVSVRNEDGSVWATTICGQPGFIRHNRRRNKLNGIVESVQQNNLRVRVTQSIGNCPKYIQVRNIVVESNMLANLGREARETGRGLAELGKAERDLIARSDTVFLATSFHKGDESTNGLSGSGCNHRGGPPGFVQVCESGTLLIPDYMGNSMFQSLGNIAVDSVAGVQFIDFTNGDSLQLTGHAEILYDDHSLPGAQRVVRFVTRQWVHVKAALPIHTKGNVQPSPYNPLVEGTSGMTGLKCISRHQETHDIVTFGFTAPVAAGGSGFCQAGQFASFDFPNLSEGQTLNRTWTISSSPKDIAATGRFTISVKKAGLVSSWLHENLVVGKELVFRGVDGNFTLDEAAKCIPAAGVLLIAGGIGVTPMRVMFAECLQRGYPVVFLYTFRSEKDAAFLEEFREGAKSCNHAKLAVALTGGSPHKHLDGVETFNGRLSAAIIKQVCPDFGDREVFQCGPVPMMNSTAEALRSLGVSDSKIHQESFSF